MNCFKSGITKKGRFNMGAKKSGSSLYKLPQTVWTRRHIAAAIFLVIGISITACLLWIHFNRINPRLLARIGKPLPSLIVSAAGIEVDLKNYVSGERSVIVFYSPSCRTCREMLPSLLPFPPTLRLIMVNESPDQEDTEIASFPAAVQFQDRRLSLIRSVAVAALPAILFVDENGILRRGLMGRHERNDMRQQLKDFAVHSYTPTLRER
jgi:hypothetical protein